MLDVQLINSNSGNISVFIVLSHTDFNQRHKEEKDEELYLNLFASSLAYRSLCRYS